jgi:hypothetical protein
MTTLQSTSYFRSETPETQFRASDPSTFLRVIFKKLSSSLASFTSHSSSLTVSIHVRVATSHMIGDTRRVILSLKPICLLSCPSLFRPLTSFTCCLASRTAGREWPSQPPLSPPFISNINAIAFRYCSPSTLKTKNHILPRLFWYAI